MSLPIIAFSGKRGVGKTTSCLYLKSRYGFRHMSFAKELKDIAMSLFPFEDHHFSIINKEKEFRDYSWSPREFLIKLGQFLRYWDEDYFLKAINEDLRNGDAIDDLRFKNEYRYLRKKGAILIRIERYNFSNPYGEKDLDDPSEKELDTFDFDFLIEKENNKDLPTLNKSLDKIMSELNSR